MAQNYIKAHQRSPLSHEAAYHVAITDGFAFIRHLYR